MLYEWIALPHRSSKDKKGHVAVFCAAVQLCGTRSGACDHVHTKFHCSQCHQNDDKNIIAGAKPPQRANKSKNNI